MPVLIVAGSMADARAAAESHDWLRSEWRYVRDGSDIDRAASAPVYVHRTLEAHPRADSIVDALHRRLAPKTRRRRPRPIDRGTGTLIQPQGGRP